MTKKLTCLIAIAKSVLVLFCNSIPARVDAARMGRYGQIASVESANEFCFFLPPERGGNIAANEDRAVAFCTAPLADAPGAQVFPQDFIQTANFKANKTQQWVQVTGRILNSAYNLPMTDQGGQYDHKAPIGAACANYRYFVNLIEPGG